MAAVRDTHQPRDLTQTMTTGFADRAPTGKLVVRVVDGPDRGRFMLLGDATLVVGASEGADLALKDPGVSRRHLEIAAVEGGVRVVDLRSKNGTLLRGARLDTALVGVGAEIVLGHTTLRIDDAEALEDAVEADSLGPLTTRSTPMRRCLGALLRVAATEIPVLLEGEPGVGHDAVARALHAASARNRGPFVAVSFAVHKRELVAEALFGVVRAGGKDFTAGAFETAHGGTLLLEDIDAAPAHVQAPLAQAIESGAFSRVGDPRPRKASVRVVATCSKDVDAEVRAGRLLPALRDALAAARALVPPLRDRSADLADIARGLLRELGSTATIDDATLALLQAQRWPGNLVELKQALARGVATSAPGTVRLELEGAGSIASLRDDRDKFEREKLVELLRNNGDNVSAAARAAGIDRRHLHRLLKKHGLRGA